jgi:hypothetical protein
VNGNGLDCRFENLRPARPGEIVTTHHMTYAVNERGQCFHDLVVRDAYKQRNRSPEDAATWAAYCARGV